MTDHSVSTRCRRARGTRAMGALCALIVAIVASVAAVPAAQAQSRSTRREAKKHFARAESLYALAKFDEALVEYETAFGILPLPGLLFNIGQCHRNLEHYDKAIFAFENYLSREPNAKNRAAVEALIAEMQKKKAESENPSAGTGTNTGTVDTRVTDEHPGGGLPDDGITDPPWTRENPPIYKRWWFWTGAGVAVTGIVVTVLVLSSSDGVPHSDLGNVSFPVAARF